MPWEPLDYAPDDAVVFTLPTGAKVEVRLEGEYLSVYASEGVPGSGPVLAVVPWSTNVARVFVVWSEFAHEGERTP